MNLFSEVAIEVALDMKPGQDTPMLNPRIFTRRALIAGTDRAACRGDEITAAAPVATGRVT